MKSKARFALVLGFLALVTSMVAAMAVFAATAGTIGFQDSSDVDSALAYGRQGGTVTLEVTDADLDSAVSVTGEASDYFGSTYVLGSSYGNGVDYSFRVQKHPLGSSATTGITVTGAPVVVFSVGAENGIVTLRTTATSGSAATTLAAAATTTDTVIVVASTAAAARFSAGDVISVGGEAATVASVSGANITLSAALAADHAQGASVTMTTDAFTIAYSGNDINDSGTALSVTSNADADGFTLKAFETTANSGVLRRVVNLTSGASSSGTVTSESIGASSAYHEIAVPAAKAAAVTVTTAKDLIVPRTASDDITSATTVSVTTAMTVSSASAANNTVTLAAGAAIAASASTIAAEAASGATTMTVTSAGTLWAVNDKITLGSDTVRITGISGTTVTFTPALTATSATSTAVTQATAAFALSYQAVPDLQVDASDTVKMSYVDADPAATVKSNLSVETTAPSFAGVSPDSGEAQKDFRPTVKLDVTDSDSGVVDDTIKLILGIDNDTDTLIDAASEVTLDDAVDITAITSGYSMVGTILPAALAPAGDGILYWWVRAADVAGNVAVSDEDSDDTCDVTAFDALRASSLAGIVGKDPTVADSTADCQPYVVTIDRTAPAIDAATAGVWWDTDKTTDDKSETAVTSAKATSIRVDFNESIEATSVQAADFTVDGTTPTAAEVFSGLKTSVFLTVSALAADARPDIAVVAAITDIAGNGLDSATLADAADRMAPTLTVTITGDAASRPVADDELTITVVTDEDTAVPVVKAYRVGGSAGTPKETIGVVDSGTTVSMSRVTGATRTSEGTVTLATAGLYNLYVTATDATVGNQGTAGLGTADDDDAVVAGTQIDITSASALLFEVDNAIPTPTFTPGDDNSATTQDETETDDVNTFISIDFTNEGKEYGLDSSNADTRTPASVSVDHDGHGAVTISAATLDGADILASVDTVDNVKFLYKATGLALGEHEVVITASDSTGNEADFTKKFDVVEKAAFEVPLNPGWNMISLPGTPVDASIDAVIGATPVTTVYSYNPAVAGGWSTAVREADAAGTNGFTAFSGTLTTISSGQGYWVYTDTFEPISVNIEALEAGAATGALPPQPPVLNITQGWNLVPVLDVSGSLAAGANISSAVYFAGIVSDIARIYNFDTVGNTWTLINPATPDNVQVGKAYWVYATDSGVVVP